MSNPRNQRNRYKGGDPSLLVLLWDRASSLEGCGPVLEELFLPVVEHRWRDMELVARIGHGNALDQMTSQNGNLLGR